MLHFRGAETHPVPPLHGLHLPRRPAAVCLQGIISDCPVSESARHGDANAFANPLGAC